MKNTSSSCFTIDFNICTQKAHKCVAVLSIKGKLILGPSCCGEKMVELQNLLIIPGPLLKRKFVQVAPRPGNNWSAAWNEVTCSLICICACLHLDLYSYLCIHITLFKCVCGEHEKRKHICVTKR